MAQKNKEKGIKNEVQALDESMLDNISGGRVSINSEVDPENRRLTLEWSGDSQKEFDELTDAILPLL